MDTAAVRTVALVIFWFCLLFCLSFKSKIVCQCLPRQLLAALMEAL